MTRKNQTPEYFNYSDFPDITVDFIDVTTPTKALVTKVLTGSTLTSSWTGIDPGTGTVTLNLPTLLGSGTAGVSLSSVIVDAYGRVVSGTPGTGPTLPIATSSVLGGIKVGSGLGIDVDGTLYVTAGGGSYVLPTASAGVLGGIRVGTGLSIDGSGILSATGSGSGSVSSIALGITTGPLTVSGSPITSAGTLQLTWSGSSSNFVRGDGSSVSTSSYALVSALSSYLTTASASSTYQPLSSKLTSYAALSVPSTSGYVLSSDTSGNLTWVGNGAGSVTSVGLTVPSIFTVSGSPVTGSGSLSFAWNGSSTNLVRGDGSVIAQSTFLTTNQTITLSGVVNGTGTTAITTAFAASPTFSGTVTLAALSGTLIGTSGVVSALSGTNLVLGNGTTIAQATFQTASANLTTVAGYSVLTNLTSLTGLANPGSTSHLQITSTGTMSWDTSTYLTANQSITLGGDVSGTGTTTITVSVNKILGNTVPANAAGVLTNNGSGTLSWTAAGGGGTVTSVGLVAPSIFTVSNSPVTVSGSLTFAWNGSSANLVRADGSTISGSTYATTASPTFTGTVTTPALTLSGFSTGTLINTTGVVSALSGTNIVLGNGSTIAQSTFLTTAPTITLTGNVTGTGTGSFATTIAASAVTLAMHANLAANSLIGNNTGAGATPVALTIAQTQTMLSVLTTTVAASTYQPLGTNLTTLTALGNPASNGYVLSATTAGVMSWIPVTGGGGTVTSVGLVAPSIFTVSGSPVSTTGTLTFAWNGASTNFVLGDGSVVATSTYLTAATASSTYAPKASPTFTGTVTLPVGLTGVLKSASGVVSAVTNNTSAYFVLGDGSTVTTSTYLTANQSVTWTASGDVSGTAAGATTISPALTVTGIQGKGIVLATGLLKYSGTAWVFDNSTYLTTTTAASTYAAIASPTFTGIVTTPALTLSGFTTGTLINTSGVVSALSGTGLVLGNGTTIAQSTFLTTAPTITLTGPVAGSGTGSFATTITANAVTLGNLAALAANSVIGNLTGSGATPVAVSAVTTATASSIAVRDANANLSAVNHIQGYTTTVASVSTYTLTAASTAQQYITGSTTQLVTLPVATTLIAGQQFIFVNVGSGAVTVQSSGTNIVCVLASGTSATVTCILASGTTAASWSYVYFGSLVTSGKSLTINNTIALSGTDGTTFTLPASNATLARTDASQTFTGTQTFSSVPTLSSLTTAGVLKNSAAGVISSTATTASYFVMGDGSVVAVSTYALASAVPVVTITTPGMDGTAVIGSTGKWADGGHIHPTDTSRASTSSPTFTGVITLVGVGGGTPSVVSNVVYQAYGTVTSWLQNNIQNLSANASASTDYIVTADTGTDSTNYIDFGINSSAYSVGSWTINGALDGYLYTQSGNIAVGTATAGKNLVLFTGGTLAANARLTLSDTLATHSTAVTISSGALTLSALSTGTLINTSGVVSALSGTNLVLGNGTTLAQSTFQVASTNLTTFGSLGNPSANGYVLSSTTAGIMSWIPVSGGGGTVTSVGLSAPSIFTVSNSPVATNGTLTFVFNGAGTSFLNADGSTTTHGTYALAASPTFTGIVTTPALTLSTLTTAGVLKNSASGVVSSTAGSSSSYVMADGSTRLNPGIESTGIYAWASPCLSIASSTTFSVTAVSGQIVDTTTTPGTPIIMQVSYAGGTGITDAYLATSITTYLYLDNTGTLQQTATMLSAAQRRANIFLGILAHPLYTTITSVDVAPDVCTSVMSQNRDMWTALNYINAGILPYANGANLNLNIAGGSLYGLGLNWNTDPTNPDQRAIGPFTAVSFKYRLQTGQTYAPTTVIDPTQYDASGVLTGVGSGTNATNQRIFTTSSGQILIQYGQMVYTSLAAAYASASSENFVIPADAAANLHLIGILSVAEGATALNDPTQALFLSVSKFGEVASGSAGATTATFQNIYNNSSVPQITTNSVNGSVVFKRGSSADTDNVFAIENGSGSTTFGVAGNGSATASALTVGTLSGTLIGTTGAVSALSGTNLVLGNGSTIAQSTFATASSLASYLPLAAGSGNALTGTLYASNATHGILLGYTYTNTVGNYGLFAGSLADAVGSSYAALHFAAPTGTTQSFLQYDKAGVFLFGIDATGSINKAASATFGGTLTLSALSTGTLINTSGVVSALTGTNLVLGNGSTIAQSTFATAASPTFTGTVTLPTGLSGTLIATSGVVSALSGTNLVLASGSTIAQSTFQAAATNLTTVAGYAALTNLTALTGLANPGSTSHLQITSGGTMSWDTTAYLTASTGVVSVSAGTNISLSGTANAVTVNTVAVPTFTSVTVAAAPIANSDLANKGYVDTVALGFRDYKDSVDYASTSNIASLSGLISVDGTTVTAGQRILVMNQTTASQNGIYIAAASGWSRALDFAAGVNTSVTLGLYTYVEFGTANGQSGFVLSASNASAPDTSINVGTDNITFIKFTGSSVYTFSTGLRTNGTTVTVGNFTANALLVGAGAGADATILSAGSQYNVLVGGASGVPGWGSINLASSSAVGSTILPVANGGTNLSSLGTVGTAVLAYTSASSGFVKWSGSALSIDTNTYLTANQSITLSGDAAGTGTTAITVAVNKILGNTVPVNASGALTNNGSGVLSWTSYLTTAPTITLTGAVTGSGTGSFATTLAASIVGLSNMANLAANSVIGNATGSAATPTAVSMLATATASSVALRDTNANVSAANMLEGYTTTATAAGTTTLLVSSNYQQFFTGTSTQIVQLPSTTTVTLGQSWYIENNSTGLVTINSSGSNAVLILASNTAAIVTCVLTSGTTAASWSSTYFANIVASGKSLTANNSVTFTGTDGTTITLPGSNATMARTDAAQTFTGTQTFSSVPTLSSLTTAGVLLNNGSGVISSSAGLATNFLNADGSTTTHATYATVASPTFTGTVTLPTGLAGTLIATAGVVSALSGTNLVLGSGATIAQSTFQAAATNLTTVAGYAALTNLTSLTGLTNPASTSHLQITAAGTMSWDTAAYLTANQSITLSGVVTGTGTTAITTAFATSPTFSGTITLAALSGVLVGTSGVVSALSGTNIVLGSGATITQSTFQAASTQLANLAALGSPGTSGYVLSSTTGGTLSWVTNGAGTFTGGTLTSTLTLEVGTTASAPLVLQTGTNLTTAVAGSVEWNGTNLFVTSSGPTRNTVAWTTSNITGSAASLTTAYTIAATGDVSWTSASFNGTGNVTGTATVNGIKGATIPTLATGNLRYNGAALVWDSATYLTANQSVTWTASGDISGTASGATSISPALTVTGIQGKAITLSTGFLKYSGTAWSFDASTYITANQSITLSGDASGTGTTAITVAVNKILGNTVPVNAAGALTNNGTGTLTWVSYLTTAPTITLTGDVTGTGTGSFAATIAASSVTLAKMANLATNSIIGNNTGSAAAPIALTVAQTQTMLSVLTTTVAASTYAPIASPTFTGTVTTPALTLSGFTTGTLINTSGVVSALSGTNLVLGNGTTIAQSTFQTAAANLTTLAGLSSVANLSTLANLAAPGTSGWVLSSTTGGVYSWIAAGGGMTNPMTTTGDMIYSSSGTTPARLAVGAAGTVLVGGTTPTWSSTPSITNVIEGYTTTATASGTTTLTVTSTYQQFFTGTTTQTVALPNTATLALGQSWYIDNNSTGSITVQSSGANTIVIITAGSAATVTCISTSVNTAAAWNSTYLATGALSGLAYYVAGAPLTIANTTANTSLVPSITPLAVAAQNLGNVINLELDGTIAFASLYDYVTWNWKLGNTVLATHTTVGTDMTSAVINTAYPWTFNGRIVPQAANGSSVTVALIGQMQIFVPGDLVTVSINTTGTVNTTIQNTFNVLVQWNSAATNDSFICSDVSVTQSSSTLTAIVGPAGPVWTPSSSPTFTYTSGVVTRVDYASDSSYKVLTYTSSVLTQVDYVKGGVTTRKVFNYTSGVLSSITQTVF